MNIKKLIVVGAGLALAVCVLTAGAAFSRPVRAVDLIDCVDPLVGTAAYPESGLR